MYGTYIGIGYYIPAIPEGEEGFIIKVGHGDDVIKRCNLQRVNILYGIREKEKEVLDEARRRGSVLKSDWAFAGYTETFGLFRTRREAENFAESLAMECTVRYDYRMLIQTQTLAA